MHKNGTATALAVWSFFLCLSAASCRHKVVLVIPATPATDPVVLPAGTVLALIAAETIDSSRLGTNQAYAAVISRDIEQGTPQMILPSGSPATLVLMPTSGNNQPTWQLGLSSVMLDGDSFLVRENGGLGAPIGTFLGGVPGPDYSDPAKRKPGEPNALIVSGPLMRVNPGSLLTFRLQKEIILTGSRH